MSYTRQSQHINGNETDFQVLDSLVFPIGTPVNSISATGVFTITSTVADAETVTIGTEVYEFKVSGSPLAGHIKVDISGGATATLSATALITAITANSVLVSAVTGGIGIANITAKVAGVLANSYATTKVLVNGSWGAMTLLGGIDATVTTNIGIQFEDTNYYYLSNNPSLVSSKEWKRIAKGSSF